MGRAPVGYFASDGKSTGCQNPQPDFAPYYLGEKFS